MTGCESDNLSARIQEKSAVYAALKPWQKKNIDKGIVAMSFTPDMVYMAIGNPDSKTPHGAEEVWLYKSYYPTVGADQVKYTLNTESHYAYSANLAPGMPGSLAKTGVVAGQRLSSFQTGGPQGAQWSHRTWFRTPSGLLSNTGSSRN